MSERERVSRDFTNKTTLIFTFSYDSIETLDVRLPHRTRRFIYEVLDWNLFPRPSERWQNVSVSLLWYKFIIYVHWTLLLKSYCYYRSCFQMFHNQIFPWYFSPCCSIFYSSNPIIFSVVLWNILPLRLYIVYSLLPNISLCWDTNAIRRLQYSTHGFILVRCCCANFVLFYFTLLLQFVSMWACVRCWRSEGKSFYWRSLVVGVERRGRHFLWCTDTGKSWLVFTSRGKWEQPRSSALVVCVLCVWIRLWPCAGPPTPPCLSPSLSLN